jgi:hypothetical protein
VRAGGRRRGRAHGPAAATGPAAVGRPGRGPGGGARCARARRSARRTSWSPMPAWMRITCQVRDGPRRPSADFFHTRSSTAASPRAWVSSATSASSGASRVEGPDLPATRPARPDSRNCRFQFPTDCSETFARRAASATVTSPARIDSTIADLLLGRERRRSRHERSDSLPGQASKQRALPKFDARHQHLVEHRARRPARHGGLPSGSGRRQLSSSGGKRRCARPCRYSRSQQRPHAGRTRRNAHATADAHVESNGDRGTRRRTP